MMPSYIFNAFRARFNLGRSNVVVGLLFRPSPMLYFLLIYAIIAETSLCVALNKQIDSHNPNSLTNADKCPNVNDKIEGCDRLSKSNYVISPGRDVDFPMQVNKANADLISVEGETQGQNCDEYDYCSDRLGLEAIRALHRQLDDDANGNVDISESDEFLRDELQYENGYERQKGFHGNDKHISVDELWKAWKQSAVHNWTVEETVEWLIQFVELPQYILTFEENAVDGATLPRIAVNNMQFLSNILGIKDPIHKQKLSLKAMDIVLFGIPRHRNYIKDILLSLSLLIAIVGCWFAYAQHKSGQIHLKKMMRDMESLQKAEDALQLLQYELDKARQEQMSVVMEKQNLERQLHDETRSTMTLDSNCTSYDEGDDQKTLQEEIWLLRNELKQIESCGWKPPVALQHWLQLTHELELKHYTTKKISAERQLAEAKEGCDKLRKKRSTFLGTFRIAHGNTIDDVDGWILQARTALSEITKDLQERLHRWKQIEMMCGFSIVRNAGLLKLEALLQRPVSNGSSITQSTSSVSIPSIQSPSLLGSLDQSSYVISQPGKLSPSSSESAIEPSSQSPLLENELPTDDECNDAELDDFKELESPSSASEPNRASFKIGEGYIQDFSRPSNRSQMFKSRSEDHQSPPREIITLSRSESCLERSVTPLSNSSSLGTRVHSSNILSSSDSSKSSTDNFDNYKEKKNRSFLNKLKKKKLKVP